MASLLLGMIYLAFISLGLPDALLGAAWPVMYQEFAVPVSYSGGISMIITAGTIVSSLLSDRVTRRFGTGLTTAVSVLLTALALGGFSLSHSYLALCLWAIPYGLGAGSVDTSLNNYVALHYASRHMSWLHCMWGIGASLGPYIMGYALSGGQGWNAGYRTVALMQMVLTAVLFLSLPLWKRRAAGEPEAPGKPLSLGQIVRIPGAKEVMVTFFCYCALELTASLWASSYLVLNRGVTEEAAASFASLFYLGITAGRFVCGFLTLKLNDKQMIRLGEGIALVGVLALALPLGGTAACVGLAIIGLGCAPIYPSIIHSTPAHFGPERSQAMIGVQMASAYTGSCLMPPAFGLLANHVSIGLLPVYLLAVLLLMAVMHERLLKKASA